MSITSLALQLIAGVWSGKTAALYFPNYSPGDIASTIAGALGGVAGGQAVHALIQASAIDRLSLAGTVLVLLGSAVGGAVLTLASGGLKRILTPSAK